METNESYHLSEELEESGGNALDSFDLSKLLFILKKSIPYIIIVFILAGVGGYAFLRYTKPVYEATARIKIDLKSSKDVLNFDLGSFSSGFEEFRLDGEMQIINSEPVFNGVLDSLDLRISYYRVGEVLDDERFPNPGFVLKGSSMHQDTPFYITILDNNSFELSYTQDQNIIKERYKFGQRIHNTIIDGSINKVRQGEFDPDVLGKYKVLFNSRSSLINYLKEGLSVRIFNAQSNTLEIAFEDTNPSKAVSIVKAIIANYWVESQEKKNLAYQQSLNYIAQQSIMAQDTLEAYEESMSKYRVAERALEDNTKEDVITTARDLEERIQEVSEQAVNLKLLYQLVESDSSYDYISYAASFLGNPEISELISKAGPIKKEIERLDNIYEESTKKAMLEGVFGGQKIEILEKLDFSIQQVESKRNRINAQLRELQRELASPQSITPELKRLQRFYSTYEQIYFIMLSKQVEIGIAKSSTVPNFRVISYPKATQSPIYPVKYIVYGAVLGLAFFLSVTIVAIRYVTHNRLNNPADVTDRIVVPLLGIVPKYHNEDMEYSQLVVNLHPKSVISESLRSIRTNLEFMLAPMEQSADGMNNKIIAITSTISGEGKTFIALNTAGILAMTSTKTILVDLDLRKPKVHRAFGMENTIGITSILTKREKLEDCIRHTPIDNLKYLTAGPIPPNPSELLMSKAFTELLERLKSEYDVIVLDTPPIGLVTDGLLVMRHATNPIYVLRAGYSKVSFIENINKVARTHKFPNLCVVLNAVSDKNTYGKYSNGGYGYGYGYGYYDEEEQPAHPKWMFWKRGN